MREIPRYYTTLFNAATEAIGLMDELNFGAAKETLVNGQRLAEDMYQKDTERKMHLNAGEKGIGENPDEPAKDPEEE